ncbi:MAG: hypothetical protein AB1610_06600 [Nitrospirota bacterium]
MFEPNEIINFIIGIISLLMFVLIFRRRSLPRLWLIYAGFFFVLSGRLFSLVEHVAYHDFFNMIEHLSYALAGMLFAAGCWEIVRNPYSGKQKSHE